MTEAIQPTTSVGAHKAHTRQPTFGALVSAIKRGDLEAAGLAFDALQKLAADAPGLSRKGSLEAIGDALAVGEIDKVKAALKAFQQSPARASDDADRLPKALKLGSTIDILA